VVQGFFCVKMSKVRAYPNDPNQVITCTYDLMDNLKTTADSLNNVTKRSYDNSENISDVNDAEIIRDSP
jgi:hypothetical protein